MPTDAPVREDRDDRLVELAEEARRKAMELAAVEELVTPVLLVEDNDAQVHRYLLKGPSHPAEAMKVLLAAHRAIRAAVCFEGWAVEIKPTPEEGDDWKREALSGRLPRGVPRPSQHPDRYDQLTLLAQNGERPAGFRVHRSWRITNGAPRTFEDQGRDDFIDAPSNFWPMFAPPEIIRELIRFDASLQAIRDRIRRGREGLDG